MSMEDVNVTMQDSLERAMGHKVDDDTMRRLHESGMAIMTEDSMSKAVHDVYCGVMADHDHPNQKDHEQARALMAAMQVQAGWPAL
jgi:hypothetical protein